MDKEMPKKLFMVGCVLALASAILNIDKIFQPKPHPMNQICYYFGERYEMPNRTVGGSGCVYAEHVNGKLLPSGVIEMLNLTPDYADCIRSRENSEGCKE